MKASFWGEGELGGVGLGWVDQPYIEGFISEGGTLDGSEIRHQLRLVENLPLFRRFYTSQVANQILFINSMTH